MLNITNLLIKLDLFKDFHTEEVQTLSHYVSPQKYFAGQVLMKKGTTGTYLGILLSGAVNIIDNATILKTNKAGELVGEIALVQSEPRSADVVAANDGAIAIITFDDIESLKQSHPDIAVKLIRVLTESVAQISAHTKQDTTEYVALLADAREEQKLIDFVTKHKLFFGDRPLAATTRFNELLERKTGVSARKAIDSHRLIGGEGAIGSLIVSGNILALIYLRDSLAKTAKQIDFDALSRFCDLNQVPFATNLATAEAILYYLEG
jgi:methylglyoxal synthase